MIRLEKVKKSYPMGVGEVTALRDVDLHLKKGEFAILLGDSGSGKTTLFNILGLLTGASGGKFFFQGQDAGRLSEGDKARIRGEKLGFVFQSFFLNERYTALENVAFPLLLAGVPSGERTRLAKTALERVGLGERLNHLPRELSGGQQQRVAFARATVRSPELILADEPTGNLDPKASRQVLSLLREENDRGATVFMITHDRGLAAEFQTCYQIENGRLFGHIKET